MTKGSRWKFPCREWVDQESKRFRGLLNWACTVEVSKYPYPGNPCKSTALQMKRKGKSGIGELRKHRYLPNSFLGTQGKDMAVKPPLRTVCPGLRSVLKLPHVPALAQGVASGDRQLLRIDA